MFRYSSLCQRLHLLVLYLLCGGDGGLPILNALVVSSSFRGPPPASTILRHPRGFSLSRAAQQRNERRRRIKSIWRISESIDDDDDDSRSSRSRIENLGAHRRDPDYQRRSKRWVVLVDDEQAIRQAVGQMLFEKGYQVTTCADAETALQVALSRNSRAAPIAGDTEVGGSSSESDSV